MYHVLGDEKHICKFIFILVFSNSTVRCMFNTEFCCIILPLNPDNIMEDIVMNTVIPVASWAIAYRYTVSHYNKSFCISI